MKENLQKIQDFEKELDFKNMKISKKHDKIQKLKNMINEYQLNLQKARIEIVEIEEKNINLAEFIRREIQNKSFIKEISPPTFKENASNYFSNNNDQIKILTKSNEFQPYVDFHSKDNSNFSNLFDSTSSFLDIKGKYKKYGKEAYSQVLF